MVDAFVNVEEDRLDFIRANQENLRSEHYKGIHDAIARGDVEGSTTGKIILPSSLTGSPRYMINNYQDVMAIYRCYENPDLFITFTCNVNWPEIHREIKKTRNYQPEDKPDIIVRVFHSKLIDMMSSLNPENILDEKLLVFLFYFLNFRFSFFLLQATFFTSLLAFSLFRCLRCEVPKKILVAYSFISLASSRVQISFTRGC